MTPMLSSRSIWLLVLCTTMVFSGCQSPPEKKKAVMDLQRAFPEQIACVGKSRSQNYAVYLHGFTDRSFTGQEATNLRRLKKLGQMMDMMIAVPKSPKGCWKDGKIRRCWGEEMTRSQAEQAFRLAIKASRKCFPPGKKYGIIGFSNGGYVTTKIFSHCLAPQMDSRMSWMVTVGAAKLWGDGVGQSRLKSCRPITLVAGKRDKHNYERRQRKFRDLRRKGADISILLFDGGHEVPLGPMVTALRGYLNPPER